MTNPKYMCTFSVYLTIYAPIQSICFQTHTTTTAWNFSPPLSLPCLMTLSGMILLPRNRQTGATSWRCPSSNANQTKCRSTAVQRMSQRSSWQRWMPLKRGLEEMRRSQVQSPAESGEGGSNDGGEEAGDIADDEETTTVAESEGK